MALFLLPTVHVHVADLKNIKTEFLTASCGLLQRNAHCKSYGEETLGSKPVMHKLLGRVPFH